MKRASKCFAMLLSSAVIAGLCLSGCSSSPAAEFPSSTTSVTDQSSVSENQSENSEAPESREEASDTQSRMMVTTHPRVGSQNEKPCITYSLKPIINNTEYELSIDVPDDFPLEITKYELWCDNKQVGEATAIDQKLRHLIISMDQVDSVFIRLYDESELVAACQIDPTEEKGVLTITLAEELELDHSQIASYLFSINAATGVSELYISPNKGFEGLTHFEVWGPDSMMGERSPIDHVFTYSGLTENSGPYFIRFYDEDGFVIQGKIDTLLTSGMILKVDTEDD